MRRRLLSNFFHIDVKNSVFLKTFLLFVTASLIPAICLGVLSLKHSTEHIIKQMDQSIQAVLDDKTHIIQQRFNSADYCATQMVIRKEIWSIMNGESLSDSYHFGMSDVKLFDAYKLIYSTVKATNSLIESIHLYSTESDFVLTFIKYPKLDFYDQDILTLSFEGYQYISKPRMITENDTDKNVVSYVRKFDLFPGEDKMYVSVNMNYENLFEGLELPDMQHPCEFILLDGDLDTVFRNHSIDFSVNDMDIKAILKDSSGHLHKINDTDYYIHSKQLEPQGYILVYIQKYTDIVQSLNLFNKMMGTSLLVIIALSFLAASLFSISVYKPLDHLAQNVRRCLRLETPTVNNVYQEIDHAVNSLSSQNRELESIYKLVLPYMENYSLRDLLTNKHSDAQNYKSLLEALGIQFIYPWYIIALIDFENVELTDEIIKKLKLFFDDYNEDFVFMLSKIKSNRIAVIINIDKTMEDVYTLIKKMKSSFNAKNIKLTVSLGELCHNIHDIAVSYEQVERQLENKFFTGTNEIIHMSNRLVEGQNLFYDKNLEEDLLNHIRFPNMAKAKEALEKLIEDISINVNTIDYMKYNFFRIISDIIFVLSEFGLDSSVTCFTSTGIFKEIQNAATLEAIREFLIRIIEQSISHMEDLKKAHHEDLVKRTQEYLKNNYNKDVTLDDVASAVFMSPRYLCGIFKTQSGMTIFEYITKVRMEAAKDMLNSGRKILDIAQSIGYNNVQSFFRFFKKYYKMTPSQYRSKFLTNSGG